MFKKLISNPFGFSLILLHLGAGVWSMLKKDVYMSMYYFFGAGLNISIVLK